MCSFYKTIQVIKKGGQEEKTAKIAMNIEISKILTMDYCFLKEGFVAGRTVSSSLKH